MSQAQAIHASRTATCPSHRATSRTSARPAMGRRRAGARRRRGGSLGTPAVDASHSGTPTRRPANSRYESTPRTCVRRLALPVDGARHGVPRATPSTFTAAADAATDR